MAALHEALYACLLPRDYIGPKRLLSSQSVSAITCCPTVATNYLWGTFYCHQHGENHATCKEAVAVTRL